MRGPFALRRDARIDVTLTPAEVDLLRSVVDQMTHVLADPPARLFPPAYKDDPEAQAEYARLMTEDLKEGKRRAIGVRAGDDRTREAEARRMARDAERR